MMPKNDDIEASDGEATDAQPVPHNPMTGSADLGGDFVGMGRFGYLGGDNVLGADLADEEPAV